METELKPCPFCGSSVELKVLRPGELSVIRCTNHHCYMAFPGAFTSWNNGDTDEHAELRLTTAWNRRAEEVIRCRDCKHVDKYGDCDIFDEWSTRTPDDFCSYGERKDND